MRLSQFTKNPARNLLLGAGALLSLWHFLAFRHLPFFAAPAVDEALHHQWALGWAAGRNPVVLPFFRAPLYPAFLSLVYRLAGPEHAIFWGRLAGVFLGLANLVLLDRLL